MKRRLARLTLIAMLPVMALATSAVGQAGNITLASTSDAE